MIILQQGSEAIGYGGLWLDLLRSLCALLFVCALVVISLRFVSQRGLGRFGRAKSPGLSLTVLERVVLEPRQHLYVVRAGKRVLLIATGASGAPRLLAELEPDAVGAALAPASPGAEDEPPR